MANTTATVMNRNINSIINFHYVLFQLLGIIPFNIKKFPIILFHFYSWFIFTVITYFYLRNTYYFQMRIKGWFDGDISELARFFIQSFNFTCVGVFFTIYFYQNLNYHQQYIFANNAKQLLRQIGKSCAGKLQYRKEFGKFIFFGPFMNFLGQGLVLWKFSLATSLLDHLNFLNIVPNCIILFLTDCYVGVMLLMAIHFKLLNVEVKRILVQATSLTREAELRDDRRKYMFMQDFCNLSDQLDRMAMFHRQLKACVSDFNQMYQL